MKKARLTSIRKQRIEKLKELRRLGINPYPYRFDKKDSCLRVRKKVGKRVKTAGRIIGIRDHGRISFFDLTDQTGKIQLWFQEKTLGEKYQLLKLFDRGDFIGVEGRVIKTKSGELTIDVDDFQILSKAIRPLPAKWGGLKNVELRHRKRYLDLALNADVRDWFILRSRLIFKTRQFLEKKGFIEFETPILQPIAGGAIAKPFITKLEALNENFYLRIAPELYLKKLLVGGYEKVFEMAKAFRNEGFSLKHNPEYTLLEIYQAYADYRQIMALAREMVVYLADQVKGKRRIKFKGKTIDFNRWSKVTMRDAFLEKTGMDIETTSEGELRDYAQKEKIVIDQGSSKGKMIDKIFGEKVEPFLIQPTFIYDLPRSISPLAKDCPNKKGFVERFELYIGGFEVCNAYSELNDPIDQKERFIEQQKDRAKGDQEAHPYDEDFIEALEYGMPPAGGIGFGIDRLVMLFGDLSNIREVILWPILRPVKEERNG